MSATATSCELTVHAVQVSVGSEAGDTGDGEGHAPVCVVSIVDGHNGDALLGSFLGGVPAPA